MAALPDNPYGLSPKRWRFVQEYLKDLNATQAAVRAGYAAKRADQQGYQLLSDSEVKAVVDKEKDRIAAELECTRGDIMLELQAIAFARLDQFGHWLEDGTFLLKDPSEIPAHVMGAVAKVENFKSYDKDGNLLKETVRLHFHNKLDALKTLANIKKIDNPAPGVLVDNRTVTVQNVTEQYQEALDDVAKVVKEVPIKKLKPSEAQEEVEGT